VVPNCKSAFKIITELGDLNEMDMKAIGMTKTMHQDPHTLLYSGQTIAGLLGFVSDDLRNEWSQQADPHIVVGDQITGDHLEKCDCAVKITMIPPLIILWTRHLVDSTLPTNQQDHRPRPKRKLTIHREDD
jgi:hypothetical protein